MREQDWNEHATHNGGWQFRQPEINWEVLNPISKTCDGASMELFQQRKKNSHLAQKYKWAMTLEGCKQDVIRFNRKRLGLSEVARDPFSANRSLFASGAAGVAVADAMAGLKRAASGTAVVIDWLGAGGAPVAQELAEKRAVTCVNCPQNQPGDWYVTAPAELLKKTVEAWKSLTGRKDFKFETAQGDKLKSCQVCRCLMGLKVFVGLEHILSKSKPDVMAELPANCWIVKRDA